ncbi:hypothetical protein [Lentzea sp. NPDC060358]|uniref:hypothetical protein n=1 Tax=Lentzea sp. NPDC060358 TaxID=3347103 RepID=UPI003651B7F9
MRLHGERPSALGLTGAAIAACTVWDAHSINVIGMPPVLYFAAGCVVQSALLTPYALAYLLVLFTMRTTPVGVVAPVRELSIVPGEPHPVRRLVGATIVLCGIAAIALG